MFNGVLVGQFENQSEEWHEARKGCVGGSQVGAILGLNPWESAVTAYYKMRKEIDSHIEPSMSMKIGTALEDSILGLFKAENPHLIVAGQPGTYRHPEKEWAIANLDGLGTDAAEDFIVEVKFSSDYWTEVPRHYVAQIKWYCYVTGLRRAVVVALAGSTYKEFWFEFTDFEIDSMVVEVDKFYRHVQEGVQPDWDGSESTYQTMRSLYKNVEDEDVELGDLGMYLSLAAEDFDVASRKYNELKSRTLEALGSAKNGLVNGHRVCYRQNSSGGTPFLKIVKGK